MTDLPGNADIRKIDEVENRKFSNIRTENTTGCYLLLTLDILFVEYLSKTHSIVL